MVLLALGSKTNPIPPAAWEAWARPRRKYAGLDYIDSRAPLFVHQYSHAWFDFRGRRDRHADYFENSCCATAAHRLQCMSLAGRYPWYGPALWGVTASDSRHGYKAWSEPDGTIVPSAAGGSIAFLPDECEIVLQTILDRYGMRAWGKYGFVDAFHPEQGWFSPDVIGIDLGIVLLMIENLRSQSVWQAVMATPEAQRGMRVAGLSEHAAT